MLCVAFGCIVCKCVGVCWVSMTACMLFIWVFSESEGFERSEERV